MSYQQKIFNLINTTQGHNNLITVPEIFIPYCGNIETAIFLSQLLYWCDKGKLPGGWIYKTAVEWHAETGLSEYKVRQCAATLKGKGILETHKRRANGSNTWHYKLNRKKFFDQLLKFLRFESANIEAPTLNISGSITEPTSEPNSELTTKTKKPEAPLGSINNSKEEVPEQIKEEIAKKINILRNKPSVIKDKFNPAHFLQSCINNQVPTELINYTLGELIKYSEQIDNYWAYADTVLNHEKPKYHAAESRNKHYAIKKEELESAGDILTDILKKQ